MGIHFRPKFHFAQWQMTGIGGGRYSVPAYTIYVCGFSGCAKIKRRRLVR